MLQSRVSISALIVISASWYTMAAQTHAAVARLWSPSNGDMPRQYAITGNCPCKSISIASRSIYSLAPVNAKNMALSPVQEFGNAAVEPSGQKRGGAGKPQ